MQQWFGEPWPSARERAVVCEDDRLRVPTPTDQNCMWCHERCVEGDQGLFVALQRCDGAVIQPIHLECQVRSTVGGPAHIMGACSCHGSNCDPDLGMNPRDAAKLVFFWLQQQ